MPWAIVADLPLGTYRGAGADQRPERIPSVARLYSALLCAAGFGPRAVQRDDDSLDVSQADEVALRWLERNPPDSVHIPPLEVNGGRALAYRNDGTVGRAKSGGLTIKKPGKAADACTAVGDMFAWIWTELPPEPVRAALEQLCPDVSYLGTTESPVRLTAVSGGAFNATHELNPEAGLFTADGTASERPLPGRLEELSRAFRSSTGTPPRVGRDDYRTDETSRSRVPTRQAVETAWYSPRQAAAADVPWPQVFLIPVSAPVPEEDRLAWAVAAHRALIRLVGFGAPPMITGTYPPGTSRPANRIALHLIGLGMPIAERGSYLAILVPRDADPVDLDVLQQASQNLTSIRGPRGKVLKLAVDKLRVVDGSRFWLPPEAGMIRLWRTVPAAIPDTRGARGTDWNFAHAALLSLGFAWKDVSGRLPRILGRGDAYYRDLAAAVSVAGVVVVHARAMRSADVNRYVHKVNEHAVVRPYMACLSLGNLTGPRTIQAIGQSRHLGGGLLVPFDVPEGAPLDEVVLPGLGGARS
jgi:CRISPR-associated protein Csb2